MNEKPINPTAKKAVGLTEKQKKKIKKEYDSIRYLQKKIQSDYEKGSLKKYDFIFKPLNSKLVSENGTEKIVYSSKTKKRLKIEKAFYGLVQKKYSLSKRAVLEVVKTTLKVHKKNMAKEVFDTAVFYNERKDIPRHELIYFAEFSDFFDHSKFINYNGKITDKKNFIFLQRKLVQNFPNGFLYYRLGVSIFEENENIIYKISQNREEIIRHANEKISFYRESETINKQENLLTEILFDSENNVL